MHLNYITKGKSNQFIKFAIYLALGIISAYLIFNILKNNQEKSGVYYVDPIHKNWLKWGSEKYPFESISRAFQVISQKNISAPIIYLRNGEYNERMEIMENAKIYGEDRDGVIFKSESLLPVITMKNGAILSNATIIGGSDGILAEGEALIENCAVKDFKQKGINALPTNLGLIIRNSEIYNGENKGIYIQKGRKISLYNNKIYNNQGEGLDIRANVSGVVKNNEIYDNVESGIEFIVGGSSLDIKNNRIWDNKSAGITAQYYEESPEKGNIIIQANYIKTTDPEKFTISVKSPSGGTGRVKNYWKDSIKILNDNVLEGEIKTRSLEVAEL